VGGAKEKNQTNIQNSQLSLTHSIKGRGKGRGGRGGRGGGERPNIKGLFQLAILINGNAFEKASVKVKKDHAAFGIDQSDVRGIDRTAHLVLHVPHCLCHNLSPLAVI